MKSSTLALAITAALGTSYAALADTTLYGSARVSVDWNKPNYNSNVADTFFGGDKDNQYLDVVDDTSRLGVQGSEDLGNGLSAIYQFEFGVDVPGNNLDGVNGSNYFYDNRPRWVGLKGDFGALTLGTQYTPYYNVIGYTDTLNSIKSFNYYLGFSDNTTLLGLPVLSTRGGEFGLRQGSSAVYTTPEWNGLSAQGMVVMDGISGPNNVDEWQANLTYKNGPWFAGVVYARNRAGSTNELVVDNVVVTEIESRQYGALISWDNKQFGLTGSWQQYKPDDSFGAFVDADGNIYPGQHKVNDYTVQGQYYFTGNDTLRLTYSYMKFDDVDTKVNYIEAGLEHAMSKRTFLWVEYLFSKNNLDDDNLDADFGDPKAHVVSVGVRHDF